MDNYENFIECVIVALFVIFATFTGVFLATEYTSYENQHLRSFNKIHSTDYSIDEWRVYSYEIRAKYKLEEEIK